MSLSDTLAEIAAFQGEQQARASRVPPQGSPRRPNINLVPPPPPQQAPPKRSLMDRASELVTGAFGIAKDPATYAAIPVGLARAPGQLVGGMLDTVRDFDQFRADNISAAFARKPQGTMLAGAMTMADPLALAATVAHVASRGASLADAISLRKTVGQVGREDVNQFSAVGGAVALSLSGAAEGAAVGTAAKVLRLLGNSAKVGAATGVTADVTDAASPTVALTASQSSAEDRLKERGKQAAIGSALNVAAEPLIGAVGAYIKSKPPTKITTGTPADAVADKLDRAFASARTTEARYQALDRAMAARRGETPEGAAAGEGVTRIPEGTRIGDSSGADSYQDANHALRVAGSSETVAPERNPLQADGRIPVSDASKAVLDEAGLGRAFAVADHNITRSPPPGPGDLWRLTPEELEEHAAEKAMSDREKLVQALGEDGAKDFERLDRRRNSWNPARADEGSRLFDERFGTLTPEQERLVYGIGETSASLDDIRSVLAAHHDVMAGDSEEWLSYMAAVGARKLNPGDLAAVTKGEATPEVQASFVRLGRAYEGLAQAGVRAGEIPQRMANALVTHAGWGPEQAEEIIGGFVRDLLDSRRAAASEGLGPKMIFKEVDPAGGSRVVGIIGKGDLQGFKEEVAAIREGGEASLDTDAAHPAGQWKLSNLGASYDVPPFLRALADQLPPHDGPLTDAEVMQQAKALADEIGWDPADMIAFGAHVAGDAKSLPQAMATIRTVYTRAASTVDELLKREVDWTALADDHPDLRAALEAVHNVITLGQSVAEFKTAAGRTLRLAGLPDADSYLATFGKTPADQLKPVNPLDGLPTLPRNKGDLKQWLDGWNYTKGDAVSRDAFIKGLTFMPGKWMQLRTSFANFFTAAIISGPATFLRDLMGPAIIGGLRTLERTTGGYAAALLPWTDAATRGELLRSASQAPAAYLQTIGAMGDALKAATRAITEGDQLLQPSTVYNLRSKSIPVGLIDAATQANPGVTGRIPYVLANVVNIFPQWIHALHGGVNEFAQRLSYLGEVRASGMLEAWEKGLEGDDFAAYVRERLRNSTDEVTWAANDADALASSQRTTLIKSVGGDSQPIVSRFGDFIHSLRTNFPESRYVLPIFTVPANAIGEGIRRLPVGLLFRETQQELSGSAGAAAQAEAYGRILLGGSTLMAGYAMARAGLLTGPGPQQAKDREVWEAQGFQPYSIRIGDHWVSYNRMDVVGNILAIPAAIYDRSVHTQLDNQSATFAGVAAIAEYLKDQAALQGLSDLLSFGGSPQQSQGYLRRLTDQVAGGFVPAFVTQLGRNNLDPERRTVRNPFEAILDKLPGASKLLDPQRDALGEETMKVQNTGWGLLPISITRANSYGRDPIADELDRLYQVTGYAPGLKSPSLSGGKEDMRDIKLEDGRSLYDALVRYRTVVRTDDGLSLKEAIQQLIDSPEYNAAVDGDASGLTTATGEQDRGAMMAQLFHRFDRLAQQQVARDSANAARYLAVGAIKRQNDAFLRDTPTEALVRNPALLNALGINLQDYVGKVRGDDY